MQLRLYPDPCLTHCCAEVTAFDDALRATAAEMVERCGEWEGYALAAPQVGIQCRLFVVPGRPSPSFPSTTLVICNPLIHGPRGEFAYAESCLSMPGIVGRLVRPASFTLTYDDEFGQPQHRPCNGVFARVVQHEMDHLDGKLFVDRLDPITKNKLYPAINKLRRKWRADST